MADQGYYALTSHNGTGSQVTFSVGFPYIIKGHIQVLLDGTEQTETTHYTVDTSLNQVTFLTAPAVGTKNVVIQRRTPHTPYVSFTAGAGVTQTQLNDNQLQSIYISEEVADGLRAGS